MRPAILALMILVGCGLSPETRQLIEKVEATTLPSGWRVDCISDHATAKTRCFAGTFGSEPWKAPFQVFYVNRVGPIVMGGRPTYPGRPNTIRIDNGKPHQAETGIGAPIVADMLKGHVAYCQWYEWPSAMPKTMTVSLNGFPEAYSLLRSRVH